MNNKVIIAIIFGVMFSLAVGMVGGVYIDQALIMPSKTNVALSGVKKDIQEDTSINTIPDKTQNNTTKPDLRNFLQLSKIKLTYERKAMPIVFGEIKNTSNKPLTAIGMKATFYDKNGDILTTAIDVIPGLSPGETKTFKAETQYTCEGVKDYKVQIDYAW